MKSYICQRASSNEEELMSVEYVHQHAVAEQPPAPHLNHSVREFRDKHPSPITKIVPISDPDLFILLACMQASYALAKSDHHRHQQIASLLSCPITLFSSTPLIKKAKKPKSDTGRFWSHRFRRSHPKGDFSTTSASLRRISGRSRGLGHKYTTRGGNVAVTCFFCNRDFGQRCSTIPFTAIRR